MRIEPARDRIAGVRTRPLFAARKHSRRVGPGISAAIELVQAEEFARGSEKQLLLIFRG